MIASNKCQNDYANWKLYTDLVLDFRVSTTALPEQFNIHGYAFKRFVISNPYWMQIKTKT